MRVVTHEAEGDRWVMAESKADPRLRGLVLGYRKYEERTRSFQRRRELPSGTVVLIFNLGPPLKVTLPSVERQPTSYSRGFFAGLHDSYALTDSGGYQRGIEARLTPIGAHLILGVSIHETARRVLGLGEALGAEGPLLLEQLALAPGGASRFAILESFLVGRLADVLLPSPGVALAWEELRRSRGMASVGEVARKLGWSHRRLISSFREQVGLTPKLMARIFRFERVMEIVAAGPGMGWAEIATECGYYDQAHLIRDVRQFAGSSPGELAGRLLPDGGGVVGD